MNAAYGNSGVACSLQAVNKVPSSVVGQGTRCFVLTSPPVRSPWKPQSTRPPSPTPQTRRSPSHVMSVPWRGGEIRGVSDFTKSDFFHTYLGDLETFSSRFLSEKSQIVLYALQKNQKKKKKKKRRQTSLRALPPHLHGCPGQRLNVPSAIRAPSLK